MHVFGRHVLKKPSEKLARELDAFVASGGRLLVPDQATDDDVPIDAMLGSLRPIS